MAKAADDCWLAILERNLPVFAQAYADSFHAQVAMFPAMVQGCVPDYIKKYENLVLAYKMPGAGGGGYLACVVENATTFSTSHPADHSSTRNVILVLLHQVGLEVSEVLRHRNALLLTFHEGLQTLWNLNVYAEDSVHLFLELSRVGGFTEDADLARFQSVLESLVATCSVRIEDVPCLLIALAHGLADLLVTISGTADERANFLMTLSIEVVDASEVAGVSDIHGVSQRLY